MNGYSPFLRHFHDLKEVDGNTVLWVGLVRFAQKELMKLRSVNALVFCFENNYKSNAVDYYVNSSIDGVRLSGNLPVLFTKMIKLKNELYFRL